MNMQYVIKTFKANMREDVINFLKSVAIDEFGFSEWKQYLENKDFSSYEKGESIFLVVYYQGQIIATCGGLKKDEQTIKLNSFYVGKQYRYQKIGSKLFSKFEQFAKQNGFSQIILCTYKQYENAWHFYSKRGFYLYEKDGHELWCKKNGPCQKRLLSFCRSHCSLGILNRCFLPPVPRRNFQPFLPRA